MFAHRLMSRKTPLLLMLLLSALPAEGQMTGQIINCDNPNPNQPQFCVDNWALDLLDENRVAIEQAPGRLPRDRKHYFERTGTGVHIFIVDTGIDSTNPDFKTLGNQAASRLSVRYGGTTDSDSGSHGTRVAGLAAGLQYGVAKNAIIHNVYKGSPAQPSWLLDGLNWIYDQVTVQGLRPAVINMSFNMPRPITQSGYPNIETQLTQRLQDLIAQGVVVINSAGNRNSNNPGAFWPTNIPEVIVVGGIDENGNRWVRDTSDPEYQSLCVSLQDCGSNFGSLIDIWAPAKYIRSAVKINNNNTLAPRVRSGTSFAAPLVAGLAALHLQQYPNDSPTMVLAALRANAANLGDIDGNGSADYLARSTVATPACNVLQRLFVNTTQSVDFSTTELIDSCAAGIGAYAQFNASQGQITVQGAGPSSILYRYTPNGTYLGNDKFNYTLYNTSTGATVGTGEVKVMVQPNQN